MNIYFNNFKKTLIFQAVKWERFFNLIIFFKKIFFLIFITIALVFIYGFFQNFTEQALSRLLRLLVFSLSFFIIFQILNSFFESKLKKPQLKYSLKNAIKNPKEFNLTSFLDYEAAQTAKRAFSFTKKRKISQINSTILFYFLLEEKFFKINFIFSRLNLNIKEIKDLLETKIYSKKNNLQKNENSQIENAFFSVAKIAERNKQKRIKITDFLIWIAQVDPFFEKILIKNDLKKEDVENLIYWTLSLEQKIKDKKKVWEYKNLSRHSSLGKGWASGYSVTLDKFSFDWEKIIKKQGFKEVIGHEESIDVCERVLTRQKTNNVLLVGEPGTGRNSIIQAIAQKAFFRESSPEINNKRIVELDLSSVIAQTESLEVTEELLERIFREVITAGNIILVIKEFHNFVGQTARPGVVNISGIIEKYLHSPKFQIIAITNFTGFHRDIERNQAILNLFEKVEVSEITKRETISLLGDLVFNLEQKYKKFVLYLTLRDIVKYSIRYLPSSPLPKKAIDILDETIVYVNRSTKSRFVLPEHVAEIISQKTQIPVGKIKIQERKVLLNLKKLIHQRVINQNEAVNEVSSALKRARAGITIRKGPMGTFLFLGPTGTGKTETSKALAESYFGSEERMIRLDMSEFSKTEDVSRLIGSITEDGILTTKVKEKPFSLILLDEIEKAHPDILNLFLQVLDEGYLTDGLGRKISFEQSIIIATSNAGFQIILDALKKEDGFKNIKEKLLDELFKKAIFRPEFINRFDAVVIFRSLTKNNLLEIANLFLQKLRKNLSKKNIKFIVTEELKEKIVELGYNPIFGAREIRRVIQDKIENVLASAMLSKRLKKGDKIEIDPQTFQIIKHFNKAL